MKTQCERVRESNQMAPAFAGVFEEPIKIPETQFAFVSPVSVSTPIEQVFKLRSQLSTLKEIEYKLITE